MMVPTGNNRQDIDATVRLNHRHRCRIMLNPEKAKMALHVSNTIARYRNIGSLKWPTNMQVAPRFNAADDAMGNPN